MNDYRHKFFKTRRVVCTGNPNKPFTIAESVKKIYPDATFLHRSCGYDLSNLNAETCEVLTKVFKNHNTFINASYIGAGVQSALLNLCNQSTKICDVFNIGSTNEYDGLGNSIYAKSKIELQNQSLRLNSYRFKTCHLVVGSIKKSPENQNQNCIEPDEICSLIQWVMQQRYHVPIVSIDQPKEPW